MPNVIAPGQPYRNRPPGVVPVNLTLDRDAYDLLKHHAPTSRGYGRFLSRLVYEYAERQRRDGGHRGALAGEEPMEDE